MTATMTPEGFSVLLLAAGKATRFKSDYSKLLHRVAGRPLGEYVVRAALSAGPERAYMIIGHGAEEVRKTFVRPGLTFIEQIEQLGTGHALLVAREELERCPSPTLVVLVGDAPLLRPETIQALVETHNRTQAAATVLSTVVDNPTGYGRIVRSRPQRPAAVAAGEEAGPARGASQSRSAQAGSVRAIVEEKVCTPTQRKIREISSGILCFSRPKLLECLSELTTDNPQKEYLLTDLIEIFNGHGENVTAFPVADSIEVLGVNDRVEMARVGKILRRRKAESLMRDGVTIVDPEFTYIDEDVQAGRDTVIEPGASILGSSRLGSACLVQPYATIVDSVLGDRAIVRQGSLVINSQIAAAASVGPFAHVREGSLIEQGARIGNFVEVKKSRVGQESKALHLTYLGDATLERNVNIGAGTVTCNYDGEKKHPTIVEEGSFIGSGTMLVAPVRVGKRSYVAAGSTITEDVPPESLALGRTRQVNKDGWVRGKKRGKGVQDPAQTPPGSAPSSRPAAATAKGPAQHASLTNQAKLMVEALSRVGSTDAAKAAVANVEETDPAPQTAAAPALAPGAVSVRQAGAVIIFDVEGKLTRGEAASELRQKIHEAVESGSHRILINMAKVGFIDSAGIGEVMAVSSELAKLGGELKLSGLPPRVMRSISASNLNRVLDIHSDEADALSSFSKAS